MPHFGRTLRRAWDLRIGLVAFAALSALAFTAREGKAEPLTAELCRLALPAAECAGLSQAEHTPDLYQQRDLWLAEEAVFDLERAAIEAPAAGVASRAAPAPVRGDRAGLTADALRSPAGPEADEDDILWLAPHNPIELALRLARWKELHAPTQPTAPGSSLATAAPFVSSGPAGVGAVSPALRTLNIRQALADRRFTAPAVFAPAIFRLGYFSIRNGYAGRDTAVTLRQVPPARLSRFVRAPRPAPLSVIVPTTVQTSPEFLV